MKEKEIQESASKFYNSKATGFDTIQNEMLTHGLSDFVPCLRKLFNFILSSGDLSHLMSNRIHHPII